MRPKVILYAAISLDGRTTGFPVDLGAFYSLAQQWDEDATLAGCDTMLKAAEQATDEATEAPAGESTDAPAETVSQADGSTATQGSADTRPLLVVPDSRGRVRDWHHWKQQPYWRDSISLCSQSTPAEHLEYLGAVSVKTIIAGQDHVDLAQALERLHQQFGVRVVRVDSGGTLNGVLLRAGLVDELHLLVHATLVGGSARPTFFVDPGAALGADPEGLGPSPAHAGSNTGAAISLRLLETKSVEPGLQLLSYAVVSRPG